MDDTRLEQAIDTFQTPFYLFDTDEARARVHTLKAALGPGVGVCYAIKANPFLAGALQSEVDAFEVCSPGEFRICERGRIPMEKIVMSGVYKNREDIDLSLIHI